jgi:hypothetical protein
MRGLAGAVVGASCGCSMVAAWSVKVRFSGWQRAHAAGDKQHMGMNGADCTPGVHWQFNRPV